MACASPTRCWCRCSADQSASPVAAAGAAVMTPAAISVAEARLAPRPPHRSSSTAEVQQPAGILIRAG